MKRITFLLITLLFLSSCSKDNPIDDGFSETDFVGNWNLTELYSENGKVNGEVNGFPISGDAQIIGKNFNAQANVTSNPNKITSIGGLTVDVTVTVLGVPQTQEQTLDQIPNLEGSWSFENNTLTIPDGNTETTFSIISFNNTILKLQSEYEEALEFQGNTFKVNGDLFITLEK